LDETYLRQWVAALGVADPFERAWKESEADAT